MKTIEEKVMSKVVNFRMEIMEEFVAANIAANMKNACVEDFQKVIKSHKLVVTQYRDTMTYKYVKDGD